MYTRTRQVPRMSLCFSDARTEKNKRNVWYQINEKKRHRHHKQLQFVCSLDCKFTCTDYYPKCDVLYKPTSNQIKSNLFANTKYERKNRRKTRSKPKWEKQLQTRVLSGLKGRKTAITWAPKRKKWNKQNLLSTIRFCCHCSLNANLSATSFEPASVMEFGFKQQSA